MIEIIAKSCLPGVFHRFPFFILFIFACISSCSSNKEWVDIIESSKRSVVIVMCDGSLGTGFFIHDDIVATNLHVVSSYNYRPVRIKPLNTKESSESKVIAYTDDCDIALIRVKGLKAPPLKLSTDCRQGEEVIVIGSPKGLESSVSKGIVSALRKAGDGKIKLIQTDASINSGNSGGPIINRSGQAVGIATFKYSGEGLGFCISSKHIKELEQKKIGVWIEDDSPIDLMAFFITLVVLGSMFVVLAALFILIWNKKDIISKAALYILIRNRKDIISKWLSRRSVKTVPFLHAVEAGMEEINNGRIENARNSFKSAVAEISTHVEGLRALSGMADGDNYENILGLLDSACRSVNRIIDSIDKNATEPAKVLAKEVIASFSEINNLQGMLEDIKRVTTFADNLNESLTSKSYFKVLAACDTLKKETTHLETLEMFKGWIDGIEQSAQDELDKAAPLVNQARKALYEGRNPEKAKEIVAGAIDVVSDHPEAFEIQDISVSRIYRAKELAAISKQYIEKRKYRQAISTAREATINDVSLSQACKALIDEAHDKIRYRRKKVRRVLVSTGVLIFAAALVYNAVNSHLKTINERNKYLEVLNQTDNESNLQKKVDILAEHLRSNGQNKYTVDVQKSIVWIRKEISENAYRIVSRDVEKYRNNGAYEKAIEQYNDYLKQYPDTKYVAEIEKDIHELADQIYENFDMNIAVMKENAEWAQCIRLCDGFMERAAETRFTFKITELRKDCINRLNYELSFAELKVNAELEGSNYVAVKNLYLTYIRKYPYSHLLEQAKKELAFVEVQIHEKNVWDEIAAYANNPENDLDKRIERINRYLSAVYLGQYLEEATNLLNLLKEEKEEYLMRIRIIDSKKKTAGSGIIGEDGTINHEKLEEVLLELRDLSTPVGEITARDGTFVSYDSGIVYDKNTGLEWLAGPDRNTTWDEANKWIANLTVAGGGWRMPTRKELKTLFY